MGSAPRLAIVTELFAPSRAWALRSGAPPEPSVAEDHGNPGLADRHGRRGRGGLEPRSRAELVVPVGVWDVSQRERPHPNKRLKLSAPAGADWRCRLGRPACHKEVVDFIRCGRSRRSLSAGR